MNRRNLLKLLITATIGIVAAPVIHSQKRGLLPLNSFHIAGYRYYDGPAIEKSIMPGMIASLRREPDNPYDEDAITILVKNNRIGYIPRDENKVLATLMDGDAELECRTIAINLNEPPWRRIEVQTFLVNSI